MPLVPALAVLLLAATATGAVALAALARAVRHRWRRRLLPPLPRTALGTAPGTPAAAAAVLQPAVTRQHLPSPRAAGDVQHATAATGPQVARSR